MSMFLKFKFGAILLTALSLPHVSFAQNYDGLWFSQTGDLSLQTSVTLRIPLGATDHRRLSNQPRLGFGLSLAKNDFDSPLGNFGEDRLNLLDVGAYNLQTPSVQLARQELYGPTFVALHADEGGVENTDENRGNDANTILLLMGASAAVVTLGTVVLVSEGADRFEDCFLVINAPDKCD